MDITARSGTRSQVSTTWADTRVTETTRRDTISNEQGDVDYLHCVHINIHIRLFYFNLEWAKSQTDIGY